MKEVKASISDKHYDMLVKIASQNKGLFDKFQPRTISELALTNTSGLLIAPILEYVIKFTYEEMYSE